MALTSYAEFPPCPALRPYVACLWAAHTDAAAPPRPHRVLPDNCVDILWQDNRPDAFAVGMMSAPIWVPAAGPVRIVAVRFRAGAAVLFLDAPPHVLTDSRADLADLWGGAAALRVHEALWQPKLSTAARLRLIEDVLLARLARAAPSTPTLGQRAVAAIEAAHGAVRVDALADALAVSRQHLALQFRQQVGLTPKLFARICRFRRASAVLRDDGTDLAALALDCGYFDQSHLIRDFHDFAGTTPDAWRR